MQKYYYKLVVVLFILTVMSSISNIIVSIKCPTMLLYTVILTCVLLICITIVTFASGIIVAIESSKKEQSDKESNDK